MGTARRHVLSTAVGWAPRTGYAPARGVPMGRAATRFTVLGQLPRSSFMAGFFPILSRGRLGVLAGRPAPRPADGLSDLWFVNGRAIVAVSVAAGAHEHCRRSESS